MQPTEPLRIIHCMRAPVGGLFRHVCDLAKEQSERGHQVGIICDSLTGSDRAEKQLSSLERYCTLGIKRIPMSRGIGPKDISAFFATLNYAAKVKPHILHGHGAKGGAYARSAGKALKKRQKQKLSVFYTPHGGTLHFSANSAKGRLFLNLEKRLAKSTDGFIFESAYSADIFKQKIGAPKAPIKVIHNGLKPSEFYEHYLDAQAVDFIFIGELRTLKGVDVFLDAFAALSKKHNIRALVVGAGPDEKRFKKQAKTLELEGKISFAGVKPAQQAFALGCCLVVPSRAESLPYIILEAAAAQVPLITTKVGGIPEITQGTDTPLIKAGDSDALLEQMADFINNPIPFIERAKQLQDSIASRFTVGNMTDEILQFYYERQHGKEYQHLTT